MIFNLLGTLIKFHDKYILIWIRPELNRAITELDAYLKFCIELYRSSIILYRSSQQTNQTLILLCQYLSNITNHHEQNSDQ